MTEKLDKFLCFYDHLHVSNKGGLPLTKLLTDPENTP
jgi:hypothetical protein